MADRWIKILKKDKAFITAFGLNLVISIANIFLGNIDFFVRTFGVFFVLLLVIIYKLIDTIDGHFEETNYLEKINKKLPDDFENLIANSEKIDMLGLHLNSVLNNYLDCIRKALSRGANVRIIIAPINSRAISMTADRYIHTENDTKVAKENERLKETKDILRQLINNYPEKISVKENDYLFEHELIILDSLTVDSRYNFGTRPSNNKPKFFYKSSTEWYKFCEEEFSNHWEKANEITVDISNGRS